jgi:hypothetical protein
MSTKAGKLSLEGHWAEVGADVFDITEDMNMTFEGRSCKIIDKDGNLIETLGSKDGKTTREVSAGQRCFVLKAFVQFEKK